jgi:hypothetical protein
MFIIQISLYFVKIYFYKINNINKYLFRNTIDTIYMLDCTLQKLFFLKTLF